MNHNILYTTNRIRKYKNVFQVLITPHHHFDSGIELMLGNWMDPKFCGFRIMNFLTVREAIREASKHPDVDWDQLVLWNKDNFQKIYEIINNVLDAHNTDVKLDAKLLNSYQIKNLMFDRVMALDDKFRLVYHMSDIISFTLSRPKNIDRQVLSKLFSANQGLRILYKIDNKNVARLVGQTDLGLTYTIILI